MGFSISWVAFKGLSEADTLRRAGFVGTGKAADPPRRPGTLRLRLVSDRLVGDLHANDYRFAAPEGLGHLSLGTTVLGCQIEEHIMFSVACAVH